jgi:hemolysin-activating ACP:hemolysin acyltransferase
MCYSLQDLGAVCNRPSSAADREAITLGLALPLLAEQPMSQGKSLGWHLDRLLAGLAASQVSLRFDRFGQVCGLAVWARVSQSVSDRLVRHGSDDLRPSEWQSGDEAWVLELIARHGQLPFMLASLRDEWLRDAATVTYCRFKRGRRIAKRVTRSDRHALLRGARRLATQRPHFLQTHEAESLRTSAVNALQAALELGQVVQLVRHTPALADLPLPLALRRLRVAQNLMQQRLYRQPDGQLCGYLAWAWIDQALIESGLPEPHQLPAHQWNEGRHLVLCDAIASPTGLPLLTADLRSGIFPAEPLWLHTAQPGQPPAPAMPLSGDALDRSFVPSDMVAPAINLLQRLQAVQGALA